MLGINDEDEVVGDSMSVVDPSSIAWIRTRLGQAAQELSRPPQATFDALRAINNSGHAVGTWSDADNHHNGFLYQGGQVIELNPNLDTSWSAAADINDDGVMVGSAVFGAAIPDPWNPPTHGFIYDTNSGSVVKLGALPGLTYSYATAINRSGEVAGWSFDERGSQYRPFIYKDGEMQELTGQYGFAVDINDHGHVIGARTLGIASGSTVETIGAFLWSDGNSASIPVIGIPRAINNADEVVGDTSDSVFHYKPDDGVIDLNSALFKDYGVHLTNADDINELGHIACSGNDGATHPTSYCVVAFPIVPRVSLVATNEVPPQEAATILAPSATNCTPGGSVRVTVRRGTAGPVLATHEVTANDRGEFSWGTRHVPQLACDEEVSAEALDVATGVNSDLATTSVTCPSPASPSFMKRRLARLRREHFPDDL